MCLDVECEYEIISGPDWRKARKPHRCDECRRTIDPGERYYRYAMKEWWERTVGGPVPGRHLYGCFTDEATARYEYAQGGPIPDGYSIEREADRG